MEFPQIERYEYKSPSYELRDRKVNVDEQECQKNSRFIFDETEGIYRSKAEKKDSISMIFAGDLLCQENMIDAYRTLDGGYDFSLCFEYIRPILKSADFVAGNIETPISHTAPYRGEILTHEGPFYCNAPVQYLEALSYAGFDMLTTANNHTLDAGVRGLLETIENIRKFGLIQTGTFVENGDKFVVVDICGFKIGFTAFSTTYNSMQNNMSKDGRNALLNTYTENRARTVYEGMKKKGAEVVVAFPHWGTEYTGVLTGKQKSMAESLTKIGYDFVIGSHAHVVQKFAVINQKPVLFSLGNLISHLNTTGKKRREDYTLLYHLTLTREQEGVVPKIDLIPCRILKKYNGIPFTVVPVVESFCYPEELKGKLANVPKKIKEYLQNDDVRINSDFQMSEENMVDFRNVEVLLHDKAALLLTEKKDECEEQCTDKNVYESLKNQLGNKIESYKINNDKNYKLYPDYAELVRLTSNATVVRMKEKIDGKVVKVIANQQEGNDTARIVYLSKYAEIIEKAAFRNFTKLESVRFFNYLKIIKANAFENCAKMTGLILPKSLETIEENVFCGCSSLLSIKIPSQVTSIGKNAFEGCDKLTIYCEQGSFAEKYAQDNGIPVKYMPLNSNAEVESESSSWILSGEPVAKTSLMNGPEDKHPATIIETCNILKTPLPCDAKCKNQPSKYIEEVFDGKLSTIKFLLGDKMPEVDPKELEKNYKAFKRKYSSQENLEYNSVDLTVYFCDWLLFARDKGFTHNCYFDYELYNKEPEVRDTFLNEGYRNRVHRACTTKGFRRIFLDKAEFNKKFAKYVKRDWVDTSSCSFDEFKAFVEKHDAFFGKPVRGTGGAGARVIERDSDTLENIFEACKRDELIVEEIIAQHEEVAEFNDSTLNTLRINTLLCADGVPRIMAAVARFGRSGNIVDNFHGGGVCAVVDVESGIITTEAINRVHIRSSVHPDSKKTILGFQYPEWEKVKSAVCDAATMVPEMRHIGWDVCVTKAGEVEFVEGNGRPNFDVLQSADQIGRKYLYEQYLPALEKLKKKEKKEKSASSQTSAGNSKNKKNGKIHRFLRRVKRKVKKVLQI